VFGTVLNRFCVQAVTGHPLTVYGAGGQTRGMLNIRDTLACVTLALENPAERGEFRVFNQFTESFSVREMAERVRRVCPTRVDIAEGLSNPRVEHEDHYFRAANTKLLDLGLEPHPLTDDVISGILGLVESHRDRVDVRAIAPTVQWRSSASTLTTAGETPDASFLAV
jgi:UDP-sulfoquinovose synthase